MPLMLGVLGVEKEKEEHTRDYIRQLIYSTIHKAKLSKDRLLTFFVFLFLGLAISFTFWFIVLPTDLANNLFYIQLNTIRDINLSLSGNTIVAHNFFLKILLNNVKVLAFTILFSFIYGAGAIFILAWNASVIGVAIGNSARNAIAHYAVHSAVPGVVGYSSAISLSLARYLLHGVPEILAYFVGCLAGGIISIAIIEKEYDTDKFKETLLHVSGLIILAIVILVIAGLIEVCISPMITVR
jgi:uncharacterized membrane protein SpoIIM required for sporulation